MVIVSLENISKSYGVKVLFDQLVLAINDTDKIGVIGVNGTGKSTLLKIIAGYETCDSGNISFAKGTRIAYLPQNPEYDLKLSILEHVFKDLGKNEHIWEIEAQAKMLLTKLGFNDYTTKMSVLSGGQKKRVALASALMKESELLILDEPTNHMDNTTISWLEDFLKARRGALIMITHDRYFLDRVVNRTIELESGKAYSFDGGYSVFVEKKLERQELASSIERKRQNLYRNELKWIKRGARARSTKQKARIQRFEELASSANDVSEDRIEISVGSSRLGNKIIEINNISKAYDEVDYIKDFSYTLLKRDRIGIVGSNGIGKSTLLNILNGKTKPDFGDIAIGSTVKIGYFSQESESMPLNIRAIDYIKETAEYMKTESGQTISASQLMETFLFDGEMQWTPIERLSGGERRRLYLLKILMGEPNVLILDEPTNDLDIDTLKTLEDYLDNFKGAVISVSHDRYFLDRTCQKIFSFEGDGSIQEYPGNYSDYIFRKQLEGEESTIEDTIELEKAKSTPSKSASQKASSPLKAKFSYKEKLEFESIDKEVSLLEAKLEGIEKSLLENSTDFVKLQELSLEKEKVEEELLDKMERQEYLHSLNNEIILQKNSN